MTRLTFDQLQSVVVKLSTLRTQATGFFVAPGLILTCAHFVKGLDENLINVSYAISGENFEAVVHGLPNNEKIDLAMLRCVNPIKNHPYGYLGSEITPDERLRTYGYPQDVSEGCPESFDYCNKMGGDIPLLKIDKSTIKPGLSGAPLLNERTGKICGVIKETRNENTDWGGGAVPIGYAFDEWKNLVGDDAIVNVLLKMQAVEEVGLLSRKINNEQAIKNNPSKGSSSSDINILNSIEHWLKLVHRKLAYPDRQELIDVVNRAKRYDAHLTDNEICKFFDERQSTKLEIIRGFITENYQQNPSLKHCIPLFLYLCTNNEKFQELTSLYSSQASNNFKKYVSRFLMDKLLNLYKP